jgi:hypothetical protein
MRYGLALLLAGAAALVVAAVVAAALLAIAWGDYDAARRSAQVYMMQP